MSTSSGPKRPEPPFARIAIVGLGVMGGSLARALAVANAEAWRPRARVAGWSPDASERAAALGAGALDAAPDALADAVAGADAVVLAVPLEATRARLAAVAGHAGPAATIVDVASLKVPVEEAVCAAGLEARWIGCHPMSGREASGFAAARADLYRDATVWTVAAPEAEERRARVHALWEAVGARPARTDAAGHDRLMGFVSHLPQLTATALAGVLADASVAAADLGTGGRDMTRLAASSPEMWRELLAHAPPEAAAGLRALAEAAAALADRLDAGDVDAIADEMARTAAWRRRA